MKKHKIRFERVLLSIILLFLFLPGSLIASAADSKKELIDQYEDDLDIWAFYEEKRDRLIQCFDANFIVNV